MVGSRRYMDVMGIRGEQAYDRRRERKEMGMPFHRRVYYYFADVWSAIVHPTEDRPGVDEEKW